MFQTGLQLSRTEHRDRVSLLKQMSHIFKDKKNSFYLFTVGSFGGGGVSTLVLAFYNAYSKSFLKCYYLSKHRFPPISSIAREFSFLSFLKRK